MGEYLGSLSKDEEKQVSVFLDNLVDFKKFKSEKRFTNILLVVAEKYDSNLFFGLVSYLDNTFAEKLSPEFKTVVHDFVLALINKEVELCKLYGSNLTNMLIDIPKIPEETEGIIIAALVSGIVDAAIIKIENEQ